MTVRRSPCASCPYRRDVPSGIWAEAEYAKLPVYDGTIAEQAAAGAVGVFCCHQRTGEICAGWAGCHDMTENLAVRIACIRDEVDPGIFGYESPVPLFGSGTEAAEHGLRDVGAPGEGAVLMAGKLRRLRAAKGQDW